MLPAANLSQSIERIYKLLVAKVPTLASNFYYFARNYKNTTNFTQKYIWEQAPFGLQDLIDERLSFHLAFISGFF